MRRIVYIIHCVCLGALVFACANGRTALYRRPLPLPGETRAVPTDEAALPWTLPATLPERVRRLYVTTLPEGAEVFIDERFTGLTPLTLTDVPAGQYFFEIRKPGYRTLQRWLYYEKDQEEHYWTLERKTGTLDLIVQPAGASASIDDQTLTPGRQVLPAGTYTISIAAFGYVTKTLETTVMPDTITRLDANLEKAALAFSDLTLSRPAFNPTRPGPAATVALFFTISGPSSGVVEIRDHADKIIARLDHLLFEQPRQCIVWKGEDESGRIVSDGVYRLLLTATADGRPASTAAEVTIDSSLSLEHQQLWSGASGLLYASSPAVLPAGFFELTATALAGFDRRPEWSSPVVLGGRIGLGAGLEADISLGAVLSDLYPATFSGTIACTYQWLPPPPEVGLSTALLAKITYHHAYRADLFSNPTAVSVGLPARLTLGPVSLFLGLDLCLALYKVSPDRTDIAVPGAWVWLYGRMGLSLTAGIFSAGLSVAIRTLPFDEGFGISLPIPTALEISVFLPDSSVYLTATGVMEWRTSSVQGWVGCGFGLLW